MGIDLIKFENSEDKSSKEFRKITSSGKFDSRVINIYCEEDAEPGKLFLDLKYSLERSKSSEQYLKVCGIFMNEGVLVKKLYDQASRVLTSDELEKFRTGFAILNQ